MFLYQTLAVLHMQKNKDYTYKNDKFKISASARNQQFELTDDSYAVSNIKSYFKYILKNIEKRLIIHR